MDSTVGDETKMFFSYSVDIDVVNVTTPGGNNYTVTKDQNLKIITIEIDGEVVS